MLTLAVHEAVRLVKKVLQRIVGFLGPGQALALLGDLLALLIPALSKEEMARLGTVFRNLDMDDAGPDDDIADLFFQLGGRAETVIRQKDPVTIPIDVATGEVTNG